MITIRVRGQPDGRPINSEMGGATRLGIKGLGGRLAISRLAEALNLPENVVEEASSIFAYAVKEHLRSIVRIESSIESAVAASIYMSCRKNGLTTTLADVAEASRLSRVEIVKIYNLLVRDGCVLIPPIKYGSYISKLSEPLNLDMDVCEVAHKIISTAEKLRLTQGRPPTGIAAASIYIASILTGKRKRQKDIAKTAKITEATIRNRYRELKKKLLYEINI